MIKDIEATESNEGNDDEGMELDTDDSDEEEEYEDEEYYEYEYVDEDANVTDAKIDQNDKNITLDLGNNSTKSIE